MEQIEKNEFISEEPTLKDFYEDMNKHTGAVYERRNKYVIEMERDVRKDEDGNTMARVTIWKPQEFNGKYVPDTSSDNKYYWVGVARRFIKYDEEVPETLGQSDYHFQETLDLYEYDGPRKELEFEVV